MDHVILIVSYDPDVVEWDYLAALVMDAKGVTNVKVKDGN